MFPWGDPPPGVTLTPIQQALIRVLGPILAEEIRAEIASTTEAKAKPQPGAPARNALSPPASRRRA